MPRFFFNTQDGRAVADAEGIELADGAQAQVEAVRLMGELLREDADEFWHNGTYALVVTDEAGAALFSLITAGVRVPRRGGGPAGTEI